MVVTTLARRVRIAWAFRAGCEPLPFSAGFDFFFSKLVFSMFGVLSSGGLEEGLVFGFPASRLLFPFGISFVFAGARVRFRGV